MPCDRGTERAPGVWLVRLVLLYLWGGLALDLTIFVLAWTNPQLWFGFFHRSVPQGYETALLRRAAGQWAAFALAQALTLGFWRRRPVWLAIAAGIRFSDLFTDLSYLLAAGHMTLRGWIVLLPLPLINMLGVVLLLRCLSLVSGSK